MMDCCVRAPSTVNLFVLSERRIPLTVCAGAVLQADPSRVLSTGGSHRSDVEADRTYNQAASADIYSMIYSNMSIKDVQQHSDPNSQHSMPDCSLRSAQAERSLALPAK